MNATQRTMPANPVTGQQTAGQAIAEFVTSFDLREAPQLVVDRARAAFVDTMGVMLAGSQLPPAGIVNELVSLEKSAPEATIVGRPARASAQHAALVNGVATHAMDFDLTYFAGQTIAGLVPAIFAVAETQGCTPSEILASFIVGAEVAGKFSRATPTQSRVTGWHTTGTIGTTAAAVACAKLMKLSSGQIVDVVGITLSLAGGLTANFGTMTKPLHAGQSARNGIFAAMLGARGFTSSPAAMEAHDGYLETFTRGLEHSLAPFESFGKSYDLAEYGYKIKPYPCGGLGHAAIDATLQLRNGVDVNDIAHIEVAVSTYAQHRITSRYPHTVEAAKFSAPYIAAYTVLHGAPLLAAFTEEAINDEAVRELARKVVLTTYREYADMQDDVPAKVTVTMTDGRTFECAKYYPSGSPQVPLTTDQLKHKYMVCATTAIDRAAAERIYAILMALGDQDSLDEFWPLLRPA